MKFLSRFKGAIIVIALALLTGMPFGLYLAGPGPAGAATTTPGVAVPGVQVIPLTFIFNGTSTKQLAKLKMPYAAQVFGVSGWAGQADLTDGDETYQLTIEASTTGHLISPFTINTPSAVQEATIVNSTIGDEETLEVVLTVGGTTPLIANVTALLTVGRR